MKVTVFKRKGTKETVVREDIGAIIDAILGGKYVNEVHRLREFNLFKSITPINIQTIVAIVIRCFVTSHDVIITSS
jgi:hypothetical protein